MTGLEERFRGSLAEGHWKIEPPGRGTTFARNQQLFETGAEDLSLARVAEAHMDGCAILAEAAKDVQADHWHCVWASEGGGDPVRLERGRPGGFMLNGTKAFCTAAPMADVALVTAHAGKARRLIRVDLSKPGIEVLADDWRTEAFAATGTRRVRFDGVEVDEVDFVGPEMWYFERPGFWHGALGPAACWAGGAAGLIRAVEARPPSHPHGRAHLGALRATEWSLSTWLRQASQEIDDDPDDSRSEAQRRAMMVRHLVERACQDVADRFGRAMGPRPLAFDAPVARRHAELLLYIRQHHAERDLETLGRMLSQGLESVRPPPS